MPVFKSQLHLGHKDPLIETDDINASAITTEKIADGAVTHSKVASDAALSNGQLAQASTTVRGGVKIDGTTIYEENGVIKATRSGIPETYIKNAIVSGNSLTLTKQDNTEVKFEGRMHMDTLIYDKKLYIRCAKGLLKTNDSGEITNYKIGQIRYVRTMCDRFIEGEVVMRRQSGWTFPCLKDNLQDTDDQYNHCIKFVFTKCNSSPIPCSQDTSKDYFKVSVKGYNSVHSFYSAWTSWGGGREPDNVFNDDMYHPYNLQKRCAFVLLDSSGNILSNYAKFTLVNSNYSISNPRWTWARW